MSNPEDETVGSGCEWIKDDGSRCRARAQEGSRYCFFHDPDMESERKEAQQRGGRANRATALPADEPDVPLSNLKEIADFEARVINRLWRHEISAKEATALCFGCSQLGKLREASETEQRIAALEQAQNPGPTEGPLSDPFADEEFK